VDFGFGMFINVIIIITIITCYVFVPSVESTFCDQERSFFGFWFLVCYATTQLATQLHQRHIQVVRSNRVARKRPAEVNGAPAMDPRHMNIDLTYTFAYCCQCEEDICIRRHTDK